MRTILYFDRRMVMDMLGALNAGVVEEQRITQAAELLQKAGGDASLFGVFKAGGSLERTSGDTVERLVRQVEASELDQLLSSIAEKRGRAVPRERLWDNSGGNPGQGSLIEAVGCLAVPRVFESLELAAGILALGERLPVNDESLRRLRSIELLATLRSRPGPSVVLTYNLGEPFSWLCPLDAALLRRSLAELVGPAVILGIVGRETSAQGQLPILPLAGLDLLDPADQAALTAIAAELQGQTSLEYPSGELTPIAIYREEDDWLNPQAQC